MEVVLDATPFYAEGGGQVGDEGEIILSDDGGKLVVGDCRKAAGGRLFVHTCVVSEGAVGEGDAVTAAVTAASRRRAKANHTATHLLQSALKMTIGEDVSQAGSLVNFERLRFDFNAPRAPTAEELAARRSPRERLDRRRDRPAPRRRWRSREAKEKGATAMFGEKYGDVVRVVDVPGVSMELCGGTHVKQHRGDWRVQDRVRGRDRGRRATDRGRVRARASWICFSRARRHRGRRWRGRCRVPPEEIAGRVSVADGRPEAVAEGGGGAARRARGREGDGARVSGDRRSRRRRRFSSRAWTASTRRR